MMRSLSVIALVASVAGAGWAGLEVINVLQAPPRQLPPIAEAAVVPAAAPADMVGPPFLAIYGTVDDATPVRRANTADATPFAYVLKGLIVVGDVRWAVLSHEGSDLVVREGEILDGGVEVVQVRAEGIELATAAGPMVLGFDADTPVAMAEVAAVQDTSDGSGPKGNFTGAASAAVLFQDMTADEILAALQRAEERRVARGWVTQSDETE